MRWNAIFCAMILSILTGCAQQRTVTISATPIDSIIRIDGLDQGHGPVTHQFTFDSPGEVHRVNVRRTGYRELTEVVTLEGAKRIMQIDLKPQVATINLTVRPAPAMLSIDGKPVSANPVSFYSAQLQFTVDSHNNWVTHSVSAERPNFQPAQLTVSWVDRDQNYTINLEPMRKDLSINSNPSGASVYLDNELLGTTPLKSPARAFPVDADTNEFVPQKLKIVKPGYDPVEQDISWDAARSDYTVDLPPHSKMVKIETDPPDAIVRVEGQEIARDANGLASVELKFLPTNDDGDLRTFVGTAVEKASQGDWEPATFHIAWDNGKSDYTIHLKEIQTRNTQLLSPAWLHDDSGWSIEPHIAESLARKDTSDGNDHPQAIQITHLPKGTMLDTFVMSPDGLQMLYTTLSGRSKSDFRSQMFLVKTSGSTSEDVLSDGKSLDLTPSFSPGGDQIVFASNRGGRRMSIWQMPTNGSPGITQLTRDETNDIWPVIDSDPRPRLYYESMIDNRSEPRLFSALIANMLRTDMQRSGMQPRVSPKNDSIVFAWINEKTGKRDLYLAPISGGAPRNLTNSPDVDEFDPVWNRDGSKIAFACDGGVDAEKRHNLDIWVLDVRHPNSPTQITVNGSQDDCPQWDPNGRAVYFRSNRGGDWNIWRITLK